MKKFLSLLLSAAMVLSLGITAFAADDDGLTAPAPSNGIEGVVTEMTVNGNTIFVYAPESKLTVSSTCTAPAFMVFGDEPYTAETAEAEALSSGLAQLAAQEGATVVFINPQGETWSDADIGVYTAMIDMYSNSSTDTFVNGITESLNWMSGAMETKILGGYESRIYLYAEGSGADFAAANYAKAVVLRMTFPDGFSMEFDRTPTSVTLFNPTAIPAAEGPASIAVAVVNGPADAEDKLAGVTDKVVVDTSDVTDGFDAAWILDNYSKISGAYRSQAGQILPMIDYAAEGIVEKAETFTVATTPDNAGPYAGTDEHPINVVTYYAEDLDVESGNVPLVLCFHGGGNTALYEAQATEWPLIGKEHGFITVSVDLHFPNCTAAEIVELIDLLKEEYSIDASRVYASGFSMGSVKSWDLFEQCATVFAGLAPMDGSEVPGFDSWANPVADLNKDVLTPVFFVGGQTSPLPEMANQDQKIQDRIAYAFDVNSVVQKYSYDADVNFWWGVSGDVVYQVTDQVAFKDSTLTVNLFKSADGNFYTALADASNQSHEVYARNSWAAWDFLSQFSRNEDGTISIDPVTYTLASDDGKVADNSYNTYKSSYSDVYGPTDYVEAIETVTEAGLMQGMGHDKFAPDGIVTRAQAVAVAHRLAGDTASAVPDFVDVADTAWYYDDVAWAYGNGIVMGYGNGRFGPNDVITSEHLDLIFARTAKLLGVEYTGSGSTASTVTRADLANRLAQLYTALNG